MAGRVDEGSRPHTVGRMGRAGESCAITSGQAFVVPLVIHGSGGRDMGSSSTVEEEESLHSRDHEIQSIRAVPESASTANVTVGGGKGRLDPVRSYEVYVTG